jgi:hypothetical protein
MRRIFDHPLYEIHLCLYSGLMGSISLNDDLLTCLVVYKAERLRVMFKLWSAKVNGDRQTYLETAVSELKRQKQSPFHLIFHAKKWSRVAFSENDRKAFKEQGIILPSAGSAPSSKG